MLTLPLVTLGNPSWPARTLARVDFPEPFGPMIGMDLAFRDFKIQAFKNFSAVDSGVKVGDKKTHTDCRVTKFYRFYQQARSGSGTFRHIAGSAP